MPARTAGQQAELADGWLHTAAAAMAADVSCMLKMSGRENTQAEEEEVRMGFCEGRKRRCFCCCAAASCC